jgi:F0F1-type ATP synthase membrane subunit c/vacuolar-type H+-ATPase subunit K
MTFRWTTLNSWLWILAAVGTVLIMVLAGILIYLRRRSLRGNFFYMLIIIVVVVESLVSVIIFMILLNSKLKLFISI